MIEINLLPWREIHRKKEDKKFIFLFSILFLGFLFFSFSSNYYVNYLVGYQEVNNHIIRDKIAKFDEKINNINILNSRKKMLIERIFLLQKIHDSRFLLVHVFDEINKLIPGGVFLKKMQKIDGKITLHGFAGSNNKVSLLMKNMEKNLWIDSVHLVEIKRANANEGKEFKLSVVLKYRDTHE